MVLNSDYRKGHLNGETLAIVIRDRRPGIGYSGTVEPEFGLGNPDTLIYSFFKSQLIRDILRLTNFKTVRIDRCSSECYLENQIINSRGVQVEI
jgi:hypothetical protein